MKVALLAELLAARDRRECAAIVTDLGCGRQALLSPDRRGGDLVVTEEIDAAAQGAIAADASRVIVDGGRRLFVQVVNPAPRLLIVGAVHISGPLAEIATTAGYGVVLIDPRSAFISRDAFRRFETRTEWPDEALVALAPDRRTAVVTLSHDPKLDDPALVAALASPSFYIGALGSRKTQASRLDRLRRAGVADADLARIHGPVGLDIGAVEPAEIAVAILAEITLARRRGDDVVRLGAVAGIGA